MKTSAFGRAFIQAFENCKLIAYPDPGTGGPPWTIGWGATGYVTRDNGQRVKIGPGMRCTQREADRWFNEHIAQFERDVNSLVKVPVTQGMFDALVSFAYNCGSDIDADTIPEGLGDSTLLKLLNRRDYQGAADEFPKWNRSGGRVLGGLVRRRAQERSTFLAGMPAHFTKGA